MSLLEDLGIPPRLISYSVLRQVASPAEAKEYTKIVAETLETVRAEASSLGTAYGTSLAESRLRTAQIARGSLNAYLSTPIKSDNEDVQRIIREAIEKNSEQILYPINIGIQAAWASRMVPDSSIVSSRTALSTVVRKMLSAGKHHLTAMGLNRGKGFTNIFETDFHLEGGLNVDVLEACLRKTSSVGGAVTIAGPEVSGLYSVLANLELSKQTTGLWELDFHPRGLAVEEQELVREMTSLFGRLSKEFNLHQLSLWRTKFPTVHSQDLSIRIRMIPDQKLLMEIVKWYSSIGEGPMRAAVIDSGALMVKEVIA